MKIGDGTRLALSDQATFQNLGPGEGAVLLRADSGQLYTCNDTAAALIEMLGSANRFGAVTEHLASRFDIEPSRLREDLAELVTELTEAGLVRVVP